MRNHRLPTWPLLRALGLVVLLTACRVNATPTVDGGTPSFARPTAALPTIRGSVAPARATLPPLIGTSPAPDPSPDAAALLVDQAVGLLLDYSLNAPTSADLYQAAYDGALLALARGGLLIDRTLPPLVGTRGDDSAVFRAAYRALAQLVAPFAAQTDLAHAAIRGAVERADQCQTYFITPDEFREARGGEGAGGRYAGVGVALRDREGAVVVESVYPGSPAAAAGLRPGDRLMAVDGTSVVGLDAAAIGQRLRGQVETAVLLAVARAGEVAPRTFAIVRAVVVAPPFVAQIVRDSSGRPIGLLRLSAVTEGGLPALRAAVADLQGYAIRGWVLDLRGSPVGATELLPHLGGILFPANTVVGYVPAGGGDRAIVAAGSATSATLAPLAVLIDGGTALLGEALAAAARDTAGARIFGEPSAGCVAESGLYPLADRSGLRITLDPLLSPRRRPLHGVGERPDETILPDPDGVTDPVLAAALRWLGAR